MAFRSNTPASGLPGGPREATQTVRWPAPQLPDLVPPPPSGFPGGLPVFASFSVPSLLTPQSLGTKVWGPLRAPLWSPDLPLWPQEAPRALAGTTLPPTSALPQNLRPGAPASVRLRVLAHPSPWSLLSFLGLPCLLPRPL